MQDFPIPVQLEPNNNPTIIKETERLKQLHFVSGVSSTDFFTH